MKTSVLLGFLLLVLIGVMGMVFGEVRINEVMPHTNNILGNEWVELYNNGISETTLINWKISDGTGNKTFSVNISNNSYALIVDNDIEYNGGEGCNAVFLFLNNSNFSCFEVTTIGSYGLLDSGESVIVYNNLSNIISNFTWTLSLTSIGKSWNINSSGSWTNCTPTPGAQNNCTLPTATCPLSFSCSNSSCIGSSITQTCYNITSSCQSINTTQTFSCSTGTADTYIQLNWTDEIYSDEEFEIEVNAFNLLSYDYDLKIWIEFKANSTMLSERYDSEDDEWKSGTYYITHFFIGPGNKTKDAKIRMKEYYQNFDGEARIYAKLRRNDNENIIDNYERTIELLEPESSSTSSDADTQTTTTSNTNSDSGDENIIVLGSSESKKTGKTTNSIIYKSKMEYIKDYAPYALSAVCIFVIVLLMLDKKGKHSKSE